MDSFSSKTFTCDVCNFEFQRKKHLVIHTNIKHGDSITNIIAEDNTMDTEERNDDKFNELFEREKLFWKNASENLNDEYYEKLIEDEIVDEPFIMECEEQQPNQDFEQYETLFKKADLFWNLADKSLEEDEFEKLVDVYITSEKITWNSLRSDVFLSDKSSASQNESTKPSEVVKYQLPEKTQFFTCIECGNNFSDEETLTVHMKSHVKQEELKAHSAVHEDVKPFLCDVCKKSFKSMSQMTIHKDFNHTDQNESTKPSEMVKYQLPEKIQFFTCIECGNNFNDKETLTVHMRSHVKQELYKCGKCFVGFAKKSELKAHSVVHEDVKPFPCDLCKKCFKSMSQLRIHKDFNHTGSNKPLSCNFCSRHFKQFDALQKHRLSHQ